eukprot:108845-Chlamydomonas_euryale.AAC.2
MPFSTRIALRASPRGFPQMPNHSFLRILNVPPNMHSVLSSRTTPSRPVLASHPRLWEPMCFALGASSSNYPAWPPDWSFSEALPYPSNHLRLCYAFGATHSSLSCASP